MFQGEMVADLCEAIAELIAANPAGAEFTARKLGTVIRTQMHRKRAREEEQRERERVTGQRSSF